MTEWSSRPPPSVGWWNASTEQNADARRWWNGSYWSVPVYVGDPEERAERAKNARAESQVGIKWRGLTKQRATTT